VLIKKFFNVGFEAIAVVARRPFGLADLSRYPLFAPGFLQFMRRTISPHRHDELVRSITLRPTSPRRRFDILRSGRRQTLSRSYL
jgi:hypothetical protein